MFRMSLTSWSFHCCARLTSDIAALIYYTTGSLAGLPHPPPLLTIDGLQRLTVYAQGGQSEGSKVKSQMVHVEQESTKLIKTTMQGP